MDQKKLYIYNIQPTFNFFISNVCDNKGHNQPHPLFHWWKQTHSSTFILWRKWKFSKNVTKCQPMVSIFPFPFKLIHSIIFSHRILFSFNLHCYMACKINNEHPWHPIWKKLKMNYVCDNWHYPQRHAWELNTILDGVFSLLNSAYHFHMVRINIWISKTIIWPFVKQWCIIYTSKQKVTLPKHTHCWHLHQKASISTLESITSKGENKHYLWKCQHHVYTCKCRPNIQKDKHIDVYICTCFDNTTPIHHLTSNKMQKIFNFSKTISN
jgi:hypothetical protein